jgi:hypothetical protein
VEVNIEKKIVMRLNNLKIARDLEVLTYAKFWQRLGM